MAGRKDYAQIQARLLADPRAHEAARLYIERDIATAATALGTVVGHIAMLGLWTLRETDNGMLTGDGILTVSVACMVDIQTAERVAESLRKAGMLKIRGKKSSVFLAGFRECYGGVIDGRRRNRKKAKAFRDARRNQVRTEVRTEVRNHQNTVTSPTNGSDPNGTERKQSVPDCGQAREPVAAPAAEGRGKAKPSPADRIPGPDPSRRVIGTLTIARRQELLDAGYDPERLPPIERCAP